jgi:ABC-type transporter Mla subunit MlaD
MKLPVPGPRDLVGAFGRGAEQMEALLGVVPRVMTLVDRAEALLALSPRLSALVERAELQLERVAVLVDDVAVVAAAAAREVVRAETVIAQAQATADRTDAVVAQSRLLVDRLTPLLDDLEPPLTTLQPVLEVLADTTDPREVQALVTMVDHLPELTRRLETDVLPMMSTLSSVAPDLHDLLAVSSELNEIIGKVPGFGRIKRRVEEEQEDDDATG